MSAQQLLLSLAFEGSLVLMVRRLWRELRRYGAHRRAYTVASVAVILAVPVPLAIWLVTDGPAWFPLALFLPVALVYPFPGLLVRATGGPLPRWGLAKASTELSVRWSRMVAALEMTDEDRAWLRSSSSGLERWRTPETSELIDLYQAKIADVLQPIEGNPEEFDKRVAARNARIDELTERYWARGDNP